MSAEDLEQWIHSPHPLHYYPIDCCSADIRSALSFGIDPITTNSDGLTALYPSVQGGHAVVVRLLLAAGANTSAVTSSGETSLYTAAAPVRTSVARLLLAAGATSQLWMPLDLAHR